MTECPIGVWGRCAPTLQEDDGVREVRVEVIEEGGFLVLTKERSGEFDIWLQMRLEVDEYLTGLNVTWPNGSGSEDVG